MRDNRKKANENRELYRKESIKKKEISYSFDNFMNYKRTQADVRMQLETVLY